MTPRERLMTVVRKGEPDRVPVKIWGLTKTTVARHPSYQRVIDEGLKKTDLVGGWGLRRGWFLSALEPEVMVEERPGQSEEWIEVTETFKTPAGPLTSVYLKNTLGKPGYCKEHLIKSKDDWLKILSVPYEPIRDDCSGYAPAGAAMGEDGIVMIGSGGHPLYNVNQHIGSELFALWSIEEREFVHDMLREMLRRQMDYLKWILSQGVCGVFSYVGPELCIPPLQSVRDFREFVVDYDRKWINLVHNAGGWVWCHSHGDMNPVLEGFIDMGVDVLNPCEPPPMGTTTLAGLRRRAGKRLCLEGNIEKHDIYTCAPEEIREKVRQTIREGAPGGAFILCPTTGLQEWPELDARAEANWLAYIQAGRDFGAYPISC